MDSLILSLVFKGSSAFLKLNNLSQPMAPPRQHNKKELKGLHHSSWLLNGSIWSGVRSKFLASGKWGLGFPSSTLVPEGTLSQPMQLRGTPGLWESTTPPKVGTKLCWQHRGAPHGGGDLWQMVAQPEAGTMQAGKGVMMRDRERRSVRPEGRMKEKLGREGREGGEVGPQ